MPRNSGFLLKQPLALFDRHLCDAPPSTTACQLGARPSAPILGSRPIPVCALENPRRQRPSYLTMRIEVQDDASSLLIGVNFGGFPAFGALAATRSGRRLMCHPPLRPATLSYAEAPSERCCVLLVVGAYCCCVVVLLFYTEPIRLRLHFIWIKPSQCIFQ